MIIALSLIGYTILQLIGVAIYTIFVKNKKLQNIVVQQQAVLEEISQVIEYSNIKINEVDTKGSFESDDEVGFFFNVLKEIQQTLNNFVINE